MFSDFKKNFILFLNFDVNLRLRLINNCTGIYNVFCSQTVGFWNFYLLYLNSIYVTVTV